MANNKSVDFYLFFIN